MSKVINKILVIAAHPDDEVLGVGGTILKHVSVGDEVSVLILGDGETSRQTATPELVAQRERQAEKVSKKLGLKNLFLEKLPDNQFDSLTTLAIARIVESYLTKVKPNIVYTHHSGDLNIDHQLVFQAVLTACRPQPGFSVKKILTFETLSSTEWEDQNSEKIFKPTHFNDITNFIDDKISVLKEYQSEMRLYPHPRSYEGVKILAQWRGLMVGRKYAEAFEVIREIND